MSQQDLSPRENFRFESQALGSETLHVLRFAGTEGLNLLYRFEIWLATQAQSLPLDMMLTEPARLTILRDDGNHSSFSGFLTHIEQTTSYNGWAFYKVILQPAFWKLTQIDQNNILVDKNVQETIDHLLNSIDYFDIDHEFRLQESYPQQEFSMQYNESIYDYLAWKMERDGIYYYFDEKEEGEHLVFADNPQAHTVLEHTPELAYSPTSGLENAAREETVSRFSLQVSPLPSQVVLRDYDWQKPNSPIIVSAEVSPRGLGKVYYYGEGFASQSEGQRLARIRAAALACTGRVFVGESNVPTLRPGHVFYLTRHYDDSFNRDYNIISVSHEGSQEAWLSQAIGVPIERSDKLYYRNSFRCIPADVQFRPERKTKRAKVSGMLTAFVDSSNTSGLPEIDDLGRYKVYFPQDNAGHGSGKASCWIRRMQNHVGKGHGMIFPLGPGVEVLVSFIDGDPDRPVIAGAVANGETGPMENANTSLTTGFSTDNGNSLVFNNNSGKQGLSLRSGGSSGIYMSSGSLDSMLTFSNNTASYFTAAQSSFAGLSSKFESSFSNTLRSKSPTGSALAISQLILEAVTSLGTDVFEATKNDKAQTYWNAVNTLLKSLNTVLAFKESAQAPPNKYGVRLSSKKGDSILRTSTYPSSANKKAFMTFAGLNIAALLGKTFTEDNDEDQNQTSDSEENWGKRKAFSERISSNVPALLAEALAMYSLHKIDYQGVNTEKDFGGLMLRSEDKNVAIGSATETRLTSDKVVTIRALAGENKNIGDKLHTTIFDQIKGKIYNEGDGSHLLLTSENTYSGSFKNASFLAGNNLTLGAPEKITISTQKNTFDLLGKDYKINNAGELALPDDCSKVYSTLNISQQEIQFECVKEQNKAILLATPDSLVYTVSDDSHATGITASHSGFSVESNKMQLYLNSEDDSNYFEVKNGDTAFKLDAKNQKVSLAAKSGIDLTATGGDFNVTSKNVKFSGAKDVKIEGNKIALADAINIDGKRIKFTASAQMVFDSGMLKLC